VSAARKKGTAAETAVVRFLQANGYPHCERRALAGSHDRGDVAGIPGLVIEVKAAARMELAAWLDEAKLEATPVRPVAVLGPDGRDSGKTIWQEIHDLGLVWHKRRGKGSPGDWYVTMDGWAFLALLERWTDG
jgi:hypothetical protein